MVLGSIQLYSAIPLVAGLFALAIAIDVFRRDRKDPLIRAFSLLILVMAAGALDAFFFINADTNGKALVLARLLYFLMTLLFGAFLYLAVLLMYGPVSRRMDSQRSLYFIIVALLGAIMAAQFKGLSSDDYGWAVVVSWHVTIIYCVYLGFAVGTVGILTSHWASDRRPEVWGESMALSVAVLMPFIWGVFVLLVTQYDSEVPHEFTLGFLVSFILVAYTVYQHRLVNIVPMTEDSPLITDRMRSDLPKESSALFEDKSRERMYQAFLTMLSSGAEGLLISRKYPDDLRKMYGLRKTPIIWLSTQPGSDTIDPANLTILEHNIIEFVKKGNNTVVVLDGLEYLISNNGTSRVLRMLYLLRDEMLMRSSRLFVAIDPSILDAKDLALLERDFEIIGV